MPGTMSFYAKRMVEVGLLGEFYDERSGRWKVGGDGHLVRSLHRYSSSLRGMSPEELRPHEAFVHGGFLMGLVMPRRGPDGRMLDPPLVNVLDAYLHLMEDNLRRAQQLEQRG